MKADLEIDLNKLKEKDQEQLAPMAQSSEIFGADSLSKNMS